MVFKAKEAIDSAISDWDWIYPGLLKICDTHTWRLYPTYDRSKDAKHYVMPHGLEPWNMDWDQSEGMQAHNESMRIKALNFSQKLLADIRHYKCGCIISFINHHVEGDISPLYEMLTQLMVTGHPVFHIEPKHGLFDRRTGWPKMNWYRWTDVMYEYTWMYRYT